MFAGCDRICTAALDGDLLGVLTRLRENPASVRARSTEGRTALHYAVEELAGEDGTRRSGDNAVEIIQLLLSYGADIEARDTKFELFFLGGSPGGQTALHICFANATHKRCARAVAQRCQS